MRWLCIIGVTFRTRPAISCLSPHACCLHLHPFSASTVVAKTGSQSEQFAASCFFRCIGLVERAEQARAAVRRLFEVG